MNCIYGYRRVCGVDVKISNIRTVREKKTPFEDATHLATMEFVTVWPWFWDASDFVALISLEVPPMVQCDRNYLNARSAAISPLTSHLKHFRAGPNPGAGSFLPNGFSIPTIPAGTFRGHSGVPPSRRPGTLSTQSTPSASSSQWSDTKHTVWCLPSALAGSLFISHWPFETLWWH